MAKSYSINITNGTGTERIFNDTYSVSVTSTGYDATTLDPKSVTVVEGTNEYAFKVGATGQLTIHVTEDGTEGGTPVVGATFYRTDATGTTYGNAVQTDSSGNAILPNLPFADSGAPVVNYKQTATDQEHTFDGANKEITLTTQTTTIQVANPLPPTRTITLQDANYTGLNVATATINLS